MTTLFDLAGKVAVVVGGAGGIGPALADPEYAKRMKSRIPLGRRAMPEDIVGPTVFLASKASDFVTGQIIYVDGGATTW